jgi:hypothetical protein
MNSWYFVNMLASPFIDVDRVTNMWCEVSMAIWDDEWHSAVDIKPVVGKVSPWGNVGSPLLARLDEYTDATTLQ